MKTLCALSLVSLVTLTGSFARATGPCENVSSSSTLAFVAERTERLIITGSVEWCEENESDGVINEDRGSVDYAKVVRFDGTVEAWFVDRTEKHAVDTLQSHFSEANRPRALKTLPAYVKKVGAVAPDALKSALCTPDVKLRELSTSSGGFDEQEVTVHIRAGERSLWSAELGTSSVDAGQPEVHVLFLKDTRRVLVSWVVFECSGPPPGYFGEDDGGECYVEELREFSVESASRLGLCFPEEAGAPKTPALTLPGYCVVAGAAPYDRFGLLQKGLGKLTAAGAPAPALYDTRDFDEMKWGQLVVIAGWHADRAAAKAQSKALRDKKLKTSPRKCTPVRPAHRVDSPSDLRPRAALDKKARMIVVAGPVKKTCLGWSPALRAPVCVDAQVEGSTTRWSVVAQGAPGFPRALTLKSDSKRPALAAADVEAVGKAVGKAGLLSMARWPTRDLSPGQSRQFRTPKPTSGEQGPDLGIRWANGVLEWRCLGRGEWSKIANPPPADAVLAVSVSPTGALVVEGGRTHWTLDPTRCPKPVAP